MAMCEDFPCCGHEMGCCPRFDDAGRQLDMVCTCGARLPVNNPVSICDGCLKRGMMDDYDDYCEYHDRLEDEAYEDYDKDEPEDQFLDSYMEDRMGGGEY